MARMPPLVGPRENVTVRQGADGSIIIDGLGSDAKVLETDIVACASVVHVIDTVLLPGAPCVALLARDACRLLLTRMCVRLQTKSRGCLRCRHEHLKGERGDEYAAAAAQRDELAQTLSARAVARR
jgi:hypothetical protein